MVRARITILLLSRLVLPVAGIARAGVVDFTDWTVVKDPPNAKFSASATSTQATLFAEGGVVPLATDIGYQTVNGYTPATSTQGSAFDPSFDFSIAIDYDWSFSGNPAGNLALGFGIGEDRDGMNSAGVTMVTVNGAAFATFGGAARVNDANQVPIVLGLPSTLDGSLFVSYEAASGDVTIGASQTPGAAAPSVTGTFHGIQNQWNDGDLLASFFIRSGPFTQWQDGGDGQATFSNFRVLEGTAKAVPEPSSFAMCALGAMTFGAVLWKRRRRR